MNSKICASMIDLSGLDEGYWRLLPFIRKYGHERLLPVVVK